MIDLDFSVEGAEALAFAALPTIALKVRIATPARELIRAISLGVQVRISANARSYTPAEQERLLDLFGEPGRWGQTLKSLLWTVTTVQVPGFRGETRVDLSIPCTYDFEVVSSRYFDALEDGIIPLELLFSGTVFYAAEAGLQVEQISWGKEARYALPVRVWKDMLELYFPNSAWLRLSKDTFDRLRLYRMRHAFPTWEAAFEALLDASERAEPMWTKV